MNISDLIPLSEASELLNKSEDFILALGIDEKVDLYTVNTSSKQLDCYKAQTIYNPNTGLPADHEEPTGEKKQAYIDSGRVRQLRASEIKTLLFEGLISESQIYSLDLADEDWHIDWTNSNATWTNLTSENVFLREKDVEKIKKQKTSTAPNTTPSEPTNTSLKVIGLLMHHLAKSPKYSSGSLPNKSQIKELLLELSEELSINEYGLSKVDERLLSEAMKYLETQKK